MRKLGIEEMELVAGGGGGKSVGDVLLLSGNGALSGNHIEVEDVLNGNKIANNILNGSLNGWGALNYSFND